MVFSIHNTYKIQYRPNGPNTELVYDIDFTPPFKRVNMYEELERILETKLPVPDKLGTSG